MWTCHLGSTGCRVCEQPRSKIRHVQKPGVLLQCQGGFPMFPCHPDASPELWGCDWWQTVPGRHQSLTGGSSTSVPLKNRGKRRQNKVLKSNFKILKSLRLSLHLQWKHRPCLPTHCGWKEFRALHLKNCQQSSTFPFLCIFCPQLPSSRHNDMSTTETGINQHQAGAPR